MGSYMEMLYIGKRDHALKTGVGAAMESDLETWAAFRSAKRIGVPIKDAEYLLDYYNRQGDLSETIGLTREGYERISGEIAKSEAEYQGIDAAFWADAGRVRAQSQP